MIKPLEDQLNWKLLKAYEQYGLDEAKYGVYLRAIKMDVSLFVKENVDLETKVQLLSQEYQTIIGSITVNFQGREHTLPQMSKYLFDTNRNLRESAWRATSERRLKERERLDNMFDQMLKLRHQISQNAKCQDFIEYSFKAFHRFDYTPQDCGQYYYSIEKYVFPLWKKIIQHRLHLMKLDKLRPWDTSVDPLGRPALQPFNDVSQLIHGCQDIFNQVDPELGSGFAQIAKLGLLDLASRRGKAPGGYLSQLGETRKPFIFMNAVGLDDDVRTLLHEAGHAFHSLACARQLIFSYRHAPLEFSEVASMSMELLGGEHLSVFYSRENEVRSQIEHLEGIVYILIWVATVDAFQHWIYQHPKQTQTERTEAWRRIYKRFWGDLVDWSGLEEAYGAMWHRQLHIFEVPFYYIEYGIAQLGALQIWLKARSDSKKALRDYRHGLSFGGSKPLPELFRLAGIHFDFSEKAIAPLMKEIEQNLDEMYQEK